MSPGPRPQILSCVLALFAVLFIPLVSGIDHEVHLQPRQQTQLRIAPMGDSITWGWWSSDLNGYRLDLLRLLQAAGFAVDYAGFRRGGQMDENENEGFPGETISEIHKDAFEVFNGSTPAPNVVLLHAGTNDANQAVVKYGDSVDIGAVSNQMANDLFSILTDIYSVDPTVCVIVAQIVRDLNTTVAEIIDQYNGYVPYIVDQFKSKGKSIVGVSMSNIDLNGPDHDGIWSYDPTHPGDVGFGKMASNWFIGIEAAVSGGMISAPVGGFTAAPIASLGPAGSNPTTSWGLRCDYTASWPGSSSPLFSGPDSVGGNFVQHWSDPQDFTKGTAGTALNDGFVWLADFNADGLLDYWYVNSAFGGAQLWQNKDGKGTWQNSGSPATGTDHTPGSGVILTDMNGDGYADYVYQAADGSLTLLYNYYTHGWVQYGAFSASGFGGTRGNTHFADINGDRRADIIWVDGSGNVHAWLNTGSGTNLAWTSVGVVASGLGHGDNTDRFVDVDGDGRCDYVHINSDGSLDVWFNPDLTGLGASPTFISGGQLKGAGATNATLIKLADMDGDGRADYVTINPASGALTVSLNKGTNNYGQIRFADGNKDGRADAFFVGNGGTVSAWRNDGGSFASVGQVYAGSLGPKYIRLADINADGFTDVISIDPISVPGGCVLTAYPGDGNFRVGQGQQIFSGPRPQGCVDCSGIQFIDRDGDGRDDLACVTPDGTAWLTWNYPSAGADFHTFTNINWTYFGWILVAQNVAGNQVRFADLNGDGIDDVMTVNDQGGIHAFVSGQSSAVFGGGNLFPDIGVPYSSVMLADVDRDGRWDYLHVDARTGATSVYHNRCSDGANDAGYPVDPTKVRPGSPGTSMSRGASAPTITATGGSGDGGDGGGAGNPSGGGGDSGQPQDDNGANDDEDNYGIDGTDPDPSTFDSNWAERFYIDDSDLGISVDDCTTQYDTFEEIAADASRIPPHCSPIYMLETLQKNFSSAISDYNKLISSGYDGKFNTYADSVVDTAASDVDDFMRAHGNSYFTCQVTEKRLCCDKCSTLGNGNAGACTYCFAGSDCCVSDNTKRDVTKRDRPPPPTSGGCPDLESPKFEYETIDEPCPPDYSRRGLGRGDSTTDTVRWTFMSDMEDQFYADLEAATGITRDNIALKDINHSECTPAETADECKQSDWDLGIPAPQNYDKSDVANPKDTVQKAQDTINNLSDSIQDAITQIRSGKYIGDEQDAVDAASVPVFMVSDAVASMNTIVGIANQIDKEKRLGIILAFLSAILFFIPIAGEIAGEVAGVAAIARISALLGEAGDTAMTIYDVVNNKGNAPLSIVSLISGPLALANLAKTSQAAKIRNGMTDADIAALGKTGNKLKLIDAIKRAPTSCRLAKRSLAVGEWPMGVWDNQTSPLT